MNKNLLPGKLSIVTELNIAEPIKRARLHEQVAQTLSLKILNRELEPDTLLPNEDALSRQFGVSKPVIREAMNFMEAKGLVKVRPRVGARICDPSNWVINDPTLLRWRMESAPEKSFILNLLEVRTIIEPIAAGLAAERADEAAQAKITAALADMGEARNLEEHIRADVQFHLAILDACGNELLISSLKPVIDSMLGSSFTQFIHSFDAAQNSVEMHSRVAEAIKNKNNDDAVAAMREIIKRSAKDIQIDHFQPEAS